MKAKKSLGQNFLKDETIIRKIINASNLSTDDVVLEVGPGQGVLTAKLAEGAGKVLAVEIDDDLIEVLRNKLLNNDNVEIINEDILKVDLNKLLTSYVLGLTSYKVIANIPYYITSKIIRLFLENEIPPTEMILMVQKEVAERIVAGPGKMSILAVSVQYYAKVEYLFDVSRNCFDPVPDVDSAVIRITSNKKQVTRNKQAEKKFFRVVKAGFCARRKTLANNLSNSFHLEKSEVQEKLQSAGISATARAQELSVDDWEKLSNIFL